MTNPMYLCYTDGSCKATHNAPGGWGYTIKTPDGHLIESFGSALKTESKVMEYTAVAEALKALPRGVEVTLFSDSESLIETCRRKLPIWEANGWKNVDPALLNILQQIAHELSDKSCKVTWTWIRGHGHNEGNQRADALARQGAREAKKRLERERV